MKQLVYVQSWFLVIILPNIAATQPRNRFIVHPDEVLYRDEASNVVFEWDFHIGSRTKVIEFLFGEWARPGYVRKKILNVQGHNQVNKRREFERKVDWRGNIYKCVNCKAVVVMYNLTLADFKSYGVGIELGVDRSPLTNWLRLVKTEPASITKWAQNIEVQEGNSTTIECRASGLPPPSVKIKRKNQTLCYGTKLCVYKIQAAKSEDQGEYVCLVQQGNSSVIIYRSLNLTVVKNFATEIITDERVSPNTTSPSTRSATHASSQEDLWSYIVVLVMAVAISLFLCMCMCMYVHVHVHVQALGQVTNRYVRAQARNPYN